MHSFPKALVLALAIGCGGGGGSSVPIGSFGSDLGKATCSKIFECCNSAEIMQQFMNLTVNGQPITTEAQCDQLIGGFGGLISQQYQQSLSKGRIKYDADAAGSCISAIDTMSCATFSMTMNDPQVPCSPYITPLVASGGACGQSYECTTNNCVGATTDQNGNTTDGTCQPIPTQGQPCQFTCASGLYCGFDAGTGSETCQAKKADGTTCAGNDECTSNHCDTTSNTCMTAAAVCNGM